MTNLATAAVILVAIIHAAIALVELLFWKNPAIYKRINFPSEAVKSAKPIVQNAGLYNGFIAAGLIWGVLTSIAIQISVFFLICVAIDGIFGAFTLSRNTLWLQTVPASIALAFVLMT